VERGVYTCICVYICANNMQILGFGGVGGVRSRGGDTIGGVGGPGPGLIYLLLIYIIHNIYQNNNINY
jgi:hypothetical protein